MSDEQWTELLQANWRMLLRISVSILRHVPDAQDAVQQGILKAWSTRQKARQGAERAYLTRIVINECRNIQRYRTRVTVIGQFDDAPYTPPDTALRDAVDALPDALRLPLLLKYMEGMSEKETAHALRVSISAVKSRLFRARKILEKELTEEEPS